MENYATQRKDRTQRMWRRDTAAVKATAGKDCSSMRLMTKFPELCENVKKTTIKCQCFVLKDQKNYFVFRTKKPNLHLDHRLLKLHLLWREFRHIGFHLFFLNVNLLWVWDLLCEMVKIAQQKNTFC